MKYVSILRGINVGGHKKIKMADLKALYETQGFENVTTYIQSGNVVFEPKVSLDKKALKTTIEAFIENKYTFHVPVDIRTHQELQHIVENCPYKEANLEENATKIMVTFLQSSPSKQQQNILLEIVKPPEELIVQDSIVHLHCPNGYGKTKLSNVFIEKKLETTATTRNWKTIKKLYELSL